MIRERLAGRRLALTGVTGFLGQGLLERLLHDIPVERIDVYIRGDAQARLNAILAGPAFAPLRAQIGDDALRERAERLVVAHSVDLVTDDVAIAGDVDTVVHSAATVSFDPPIDEAFDINLSASLKMLEASRGKRYVHVSTAYVAGVTRGTQAEEPIGRDVDWRAEAAFARRVRADAEDASRRPEHLARFMARARRGGLGKAGPQSVAARAEQLRREWVTKRLVAHGGSRARSLGWPDVYTFTKGLTEIAIGELRGETPVQIVRPSIIESALRHPYPGWIEGFRVAEPVILAYGRGALPEFPGIPEGVLDLIPVDMVVNCILAVAASEPEPLGFYHVSSGHRNPLRFRDMYENCREYFQRHPLPERNRGAFRVPEWTFPGSRAVAKRLDTAERVIAAAERGVERLGRNETARKAARKVDRWRAQLDFVTKYAKLYGPYTDVEVIYTDERAAALHDSLPASDREEFCFDPTVFRWDTYLQEIHNPAISVLLRMPRPARAEPRVAIEPVNGTRVLAALDVEGTIVASNVLEAYLWLRLLDAPREEWPGAIAGLLRRVPSLLGAEHRDRGEFLRAFYRRYRGANEAQVRALAAEHMGEMILRRLAPAAVRRIREHRAAGHHVVLVTGAADFVVEPLRPLVDDVVAAGLRVRAGRFTGDLDRPPMVGEARASWLRRYAAERGFDLSKSYAYADSMSDLPMLHAVGNPVAVNPDVALTRAARANRWPIEQWSAAGGTPKLMLPSEPAGAVR